MKTQKFKKLISTKTKKKFKTDEIDVNKILVSQKEPYGTYKSIKYLILFGYNDDDVTRPLCIKLPQMAGSVKCFDSNKTVSFKVTDKKLLQNYTKMWEKVSNLMDIKFDHEPVYGDNDKYIKTKIKIFRNKVNTNFQGKKCQKKFIMQMFVINNVIKASKKYYPQTLLEEWKHEAKKAKMGNLINDKLESSLSDDESDNETEFGNESDDE